MNKFFLFQTGFIPVGLDWSCSTAALLTFGTKSFFAVKTALFHVGCLAAPLPSTYLVPGTPHPNYDNQMSSRRTNKTFLSGEPQSM